MEKLENGIRQLDYIRSEMINEYMITSDKKYKELIEALDNVINTLIEEYVSILEDKNG